MNSNRPREALLLLVRLKRIEPPTSWFEARRSIIETINYYAYFKFSKHDPSQIFVMFCAAL